MIEYREEEVVIKVYFWTCPQCKRQELHFPRSPEELSGKELFCDECQQAIEDEQNAREEAAWREAVAARFEHLAAATVLLVGIGEDYRWWDEDPEMVDPHMMLVRTQDGKTYLIEVAPEGGFLIIKEVGGGRWRMS